MFRVRDDQNLALRRKAIRDPIVDPMRSIDEQDAAPKLNDDQRAVKLRKAGVAMLSLGNLELRRPPHFRTY